jgi:hypothetical protein
MGVLHFFALLTKRQKETERQKDRKTERQKDRKTERQKDRKTERQKDNGESRDKWGIFFSTYFKIRGILPPICH